MSQELHLWIKKLGILLGLGLLCYGIYITKNIVSLLMISGFISLLIIPIVTWGKIKKIPEWVMILFIYICICILAGIIISTIIPIIINYISLIVTDVINWSNSAQEMYMKEGIKSFHLPSFLEYGLIHILSEQNIDSLLQIIEKNADAIQSFLSNQIGSITSGGVSMISSFGGIVINWFLIGITTFFMILERDSIGQFILSLSPKGLSVFFLKNFNKIQTVCTAWIRATAILSFSIFSFIFIGLYLVKWIFGFPIDNIFSLALISGLMEFIPYIGPILAAFPALIVGLGISWEAALVILIVYTIIQQAEGNILVPYVMSKSLDLSPLLVFIMMLLGGSFGGILGIILAVPLGGMLRIVYLDYQEGREQKTGASRTKARLKSPLSKKG